MSLICQKLQQGRYNCIFQLDLNKNNNKNAWTWPQLFDTYTEQIMKGADMDKYGTQIGERNISNQTYADDTALCANDHTEVTNVIYKLNAAGVKKSLKLNANKTKFLHIGKSHYSPITIGNEGPECVDTSNT
ncbi:endonuclease-reverse transcriptase [Plakobranchus ocellatus]|uniref:Endonuclease-reverse transcriptase n=1 Tax=Plakobranchus ocellatus TaxID=259542 RepID=A0AAV4BS73_9GAST|nr:endonuclease-reverse transcriptase [Plakobranchus ocellatus]